jgi:hypothetical protein
MNLTCSIAACNQKSGTLVRRALGLVSMTPRAELWHVLSMHTNTHTRMPQASCTRPHAASQLHKSACRKPAAHALMPQASCTHPHAASQLHSLSCCKPAAHALMPRASCTHALMPQVSCTHSHAASQLHTLSCRKPAAHTRMP